MSKHVFFAMIIAGAMLDAPGRAQEISRDPNGGVKTQSFVPSEKPRTMVELGRKGSKTRRPANVYSGVPVYPVAPFGEAKKGDPGDSSKVSSEATATTSMDVRTARFASVETATVTSSPVRFESSSAGARPEKSEAASVNYSDPRAQIVSPVDGSVLSPTQTFVWTPGYGVDGYYMQLGSCFGCNDLLDEYEGQNLSRTVALPVDGRAVYLTLFSYIQGDWYWIEYEYQAAWGQSPTPAQMTAPNDGSTLSSRQTFVWNPGYAVDAFYLQIGSCEGCNDILDENEHQNMSRTADIPEDGRTIFTRLFSSIGGNWYYYDYQYRASHATSTNTVRVNIVNQLAYAVNVSVNGKVVGSCPAMTTAGVDVKVSTLSVSFDLIQPTLSGRSLGDRMSGTFSTITNPSGTINFQVTNHIGNNYYFLPQITNNTPVALEIEVNGGLQAENRCNCVAAAGAARVASGYYLFYSNSNVRVFRDGSNYNGSYRYFGIDNGAGTSLTKFVTGTDAKVELVVSKAP